MKINVSVSKTIVSSTEILETTKEIRNKIKWDPCYEKLKKEKGRTMVRCSICVKHKSVSLQTRQKNHLPPIYSELGTIPRNEILINHLSSIEHKECIKVENMKNLSISEVNINAPLNKLVSRQNEKLALKIGKYMIEVFNDAKRCTLSAWSWPSREVVQMKKSQLNLLEPPKKIDIKEGDLQYINSTTHNELLNSIVETDKPLLVNKLKNALAISLRVDGSVDRTQVDNIHVMAKIITKNGDSELVFIGFKEPIQKGVIGYYEVIKSTIQELMPFEDLLSILSSIATDGASVNIGQKNGLWALIDSNRYSNKIQVPLLKMWCAVHRSALAWGQLTSNVIEVHKLIVTCSAISSHFHQSGLRTKELKDIANNEGMSFTQLPKYVEVRWTEFTYKEF